MTKENDATGRGRPSWWFTVFAIFIAAVVCFVAGSVISRRLPGKISQTVATDSPPLSLPNSTKPPIRTSQKPLQADDQAIRQFREFEEWSKGRNLAARTELVRLINMRHRNGLGEEWERAAEKELENSKTVEQFATNKLISPGLRAFYDEDDSGFYLKTSLLLGDSDSESNKYGEIWNRWFKKLDKSNGCLIARRYLCERIADLRVIRSAAELLSLLTMDEQKFPLLAWAGKLSEDQLREAFENVEESHMPFVFPIECDAAELLSTCWPTVNGDSESANPVDRTPPESIAGLHRQLRLERNEKLNGVSEEQRAAAIKTFDSIETLLKNEEQRTNRVYREVWSKKALTD